MDSVECNYGTSVVVSSNFLEFPGKISLLGLIFAYLLRVKFICY